MKCPKCDIHKILNDFWLLDGSEYSIIRDLINEEIDRYEEKIKLQEKDNVLESEENARLRLYYQDKRMVDFYIVMKSKVDYIISNGLHKHHTKVKL